MAGNSYQFIQLSGLSNRTFDGSEQLGVIAGGAPYAGTVRDLVQSGLGTTAARGVSGEVWLANRPVGVEGDGSRNSPYNASTRLQFDTRAAAAFAANKLLCLHEGLYLTWGWWGGLVLPNTPGCGVVGSGMGRSLIRVDPSLETSGAFIAGQWVLTNYFAVANNVVVENLTIDCGANLFSSLPVYAMAAVSLTGNNCRIHRVEVLNSYGNDASFGSGPSAGECFSINAGGGSEAVATTGAVISDCLVHSPRGNYNNGICIYDSNGRTAPHHGGIIRDCQVYDFAHAGFGHMAAVNTFGSKVTRLFTKNCDIGIYTEGSHGIVATNCEFRECNKYGVRLRTSSNYVVQGVYDTKISECMFEMRCTVPSNFGAVSGDEGVGAGPMKRIRATGNTVIRHSESNPGGPGSAFFLPTGTGRSYEIEGNKIDAGFVGENVLPSDVYLRRNRTLDGATIASLTDT